jgi:flagellar basal body-associated protein FliL
MTDEQSANQPVEQPVTQSAAAAVQPEGDLSKRTLVMLVALSCIISLVGTVAMVYELSNTHPAPAITQNQNQASAQVGFAIAPPQAKQAGSGATGFATLRIGE